MRTCHLSVTPGTPAPLLPLQKIYITYINTQLLPIMEINQNRASTMFTISMRNPLMPKLIRFQRLIALMPFDFTGFGVNEQIAMLGADGTIAAVDLVG